MIFRGFTSLFKDITGGNAKIKKSEYLPSGKFPIIDQGKDLIGGYSDLNKTVKRKGEVIVFGDHTGCLKYVDFDFLLGADGVKVIQPNYDNLDTKYAYYLLQKVHIPDTGYDRKFKYLKRTKIPLPPVATQKKIAAILDAADAHRQKTRQLLAKYDELAQSIFLEMFGDPVTNPKGWNYLKLDDALQFMTSGSRGWAKYYSKSGSIFLRIQNIGHNELKLKEVTYVNAPEDAESKRTKVKSGDVILTITADLGRTAVIPIDFPAANINQHLALLRLKSFYNPIFVSSYIASKGGQSQFLKLDKGGVKAGLNFADIKSFRVFFPPKDLQDSFANRLELIYHQKEQSKENLQNAENLFNSALLKAFKGELVEGKKLKNS